MCYCLCCSGNSISNNRNNRNVISSGINSKRLIDFFNGIIFKDNNKDNKISSDKNINVISIVILIIKFWRLNVTIDFIIIKMILIVIIVAIVLNLVIILIILILTIFCHSQKIFECLIFSPSDRGETFLLKKTKHD